MTIWVDHEGEATTKYQKTASHYQSLLRLFMTTATSIPWVHSSRCPIPGRHFLIYLQYNLENLSFFYSSLGPRARSLTPQNSNKNARSRNHVAISKLPHLVY